MFGEDVSTALVNMGEVMFIFESEHKNEKPDYTIDGFRAATKIFMNVIMDKMWELQQSEDLDMEDKIKMAEKCGQDLRNFVKIYTNIDTFELYNK